MRPASPEARGRPGTRARGVLSPLQRRLGLLLLAAGLVFPGLAAGPLERAEIYFLDGARSMVERGDFLVPFFQGRPFFDKPILTYWLMAAAFETFGPSAWAARLVPAVAALGVVLATVLLGRRLFGERTGLAAGVVLATTLAFVAFGRTAMSDMLLTLWTTVAVLLAAWVLRWPSAVASPAPAWAVVAIGAVLGLGFATKGPVALLMAGLPIFLMWWPGRRQTPAPGGTLALTALAFVALGGAWFALIYARMGSGPLVHFFFKENLERFAGEAYDVGRPFWYYPPAYLLAGLPWSLLLVPALRRVTRADGSALLAAWGLLALLPLSLSRGKLDYYLLPLYPAIALLVARWLVAVRPWDAFDRAWSRGASFVAAAGLGALALLPGRFDAGWLPSPAACQLLVAMAVIAALASLAAAMRPSPRRLFVTLATSSAAMGLILATFFLPAFRAGQPNTALAEDIRRESQFRPEVRVVACDDPARVERDVLFEARVTVERRCDLWNVAPSFQPFLFVLRPEEQASLEAIPGFHEVARYRYLPAATLTLSGLLEPKAAGVMVLGANFATGDPVAEARRKKQRKQELREEDE